MKTGVIVARFQVDYLTTGQVDLIMSVSKIYKHAKDKIVIVLGEPEVYLTNRNPLLFQFRKQMLQEQLGYYKNIDIISIKDNRSNEEWSKNLDNLLEPYKHVTLFYSRDSFVTSYLGNHRTKEIKPKYECSATERRKEIANLKTVATTGAFRQGIIYAVENKFPTAYPTVDIAVLRIVSHSGNMIAPYGFETTELLLGRKAGRDKYCFIGGFVDPTDESLEAAARRELSEEVIGLEVGPFKYISSHKVSDFRYQNTKDGIITSLLMTYKFGGTETAGDDIQEVRWFDLNNFDMNILTPHHHILFESLKKYLENEIYNNS